MNTERFECIDLQNKKILKIVNSGFKVFAKNNFEKASTNLIVEDAGISRGLLYHYFQNKKELFEFLLYFSGKQILNNMLTQVDWSNQDFLIRIRQALVSKIETLEKFPYLYEFCNKYARSYSDELTEKIIPDISHRLFEENLEFSQLRSDVDIELMKNTVLHTLSRITTEIFKEGSEISGRKKFQMAVIEIDKYLKFFRCVFYK